MENSQKISYLKWKRFNFSYTICWEFPMSKTLYQVNLFHLKNLHLAEESD